MKKILSSLGVSKNRILDKTWTNVRVALRSSIVRNVAVSAAIMVAALFVIFGVANADKPLTPVSAVKSPIPQPVTVVLNCDESWNPNCVATSSTTSGRKLRSYFYIDGRFRGSGNQTYPNVCTLFQLRDGIHTARVYAIDSKGNSASVGPYKVIHCDRFAPTVAISLWYGRGWTVHIVPFAADYGSGLASKAFSVDGIDQTWISYSNACAQMSLASGWHTAQVTATDNLGHVATTSLRRFHCP